MTQGCHENFRIRQLRSGNRSIFHTRYRRAQTHRRVWAGLRDWVDRLGNQEKLLDEDGSGKWDAPNAEIVEELGDAMWYCFALAKIANIDSPVNIFIHDVRNLVNELSALDDRSDQIRGVIGPENREAFLAAAESFEEARDYDLQ